MLIIKVSGVQTRIAEGLVLATSGVWIPALKGFLHQKDLKYILKRDKTFPQWPKGRSCPLLPRVFSAWWTKGAAQSGLGLDFIAVIAQVDKPRFSENLVRNTRSHGHITRLEEGSCNAQSLRTRQLVLHGLYEDVLPHCHYEKNFKKMHLNVKLKLTNVNNVTQTSSRRRALWWLQPSAVPCHCGKTGAAMI